MFENPELKPEQPPTSIEIEGHTIDVCTPAAGTVFIVVDDWGTTLRLTDTGLEVSELQDQLQALFHLKQIISSFAHNSEKNLLQLIETHSESERAFQIASPAIAAVSKKIIQIVFVLIHFKSAPAVFKELQETQSHNRAFLTLLRSITNYFITAQEGYNAVLRVFQHVAIHNDKKVLLERRLQLMRDISDVALRASRACQNIEANFKNRSKFLSE